MAKELKDLTKRSENYSQWYNDLVVKADLAEQSAVRGCMVIKPYGYAIWEKMQRQLDDMFKETEHRMLLRNSVPRSVKYHSAMPYHPASLPRWYTCQVHRQSAH